MNSINLNEMPNDCSFNSVQDVEQWCDSRDISFEESTKILTKAETMKEAQMIWENECWWCDEL